jgi:hypothetical protein
MTPNEREWVFGGPDARVDVLLEPLPGHATDELVERLKDEGASQVTVLSANFVSARVARAALRSLESIAIAHPKATKQMHRGR